MDPSPESETNAETSSTGLAPNIAALLCYVFGFITGIVFLVMENESRFVRFHAMQSTLTFLGLFIATIVSGFLPLIGSLLNALLSLTTLVVWVILMWKAFQGELYKLPWVGDLAEEQVNKA